MFNGKRPVVYVAGKMTGLPDYNFPAFDAARDKLVSKGFDVVSPADIDREEGFTGQDVASDTFRQAAMRRDIVELAKCDFIYLLPSWQDSPGATLEYSYAKYVGIPLLNPPLILGLSGFATAGKDTVAEHLVVDYGYTRVAFADALKEISYASNPTLAADVLAYGWTEAKKKQENRKYLQDLGVSVRDVLGPDTWVNTAFRHIQPGKKYVITDLRFPSELERIRSYPGHMTVWLERPGVGPVNNHISERGLKDHTFDMVLKNSGTLDEVRYLAEEVAIRHEKKISSETSG